MKEYKTISIRTSDDVTIAAHYYPGTSKKGIVLMHQLANSKESWYKLIEELPEEYHIISIDLRGHGASGLKWEEFEDEDYNKMTEDCKAGYDYLKERGVEEIAVAGASIGANTAIKFSLKNEATTIILLSPGMNFRGINIEEDMEKITKPTLIIVGELDGYSLQSSREIYEKIPIEDKHLQIMNTKSHGTSLLDEEVRSDIIAWLEEH